MADEKPIHLESIPFGGFSKNTIVNQRAGLKVCIDRGQMDYNVGVGRTPRVAREPVFIQFIAGHAWVSHEILDNGGNPVDAWRILGAETRAEAKKKIKAIRAYGEQFQFAGDDAEVVVENAAGRSAAVATK